MIAEFPTISLEHDPALNETVPRPLGGPHLRSAQVRTASQFRVDSPDILCSNQFGRRETPAIKVSTG